MPNVCGRLTVGLMLPAAANTDDGQVDTARLLETAGRAEAAGFDGVYVGDHLLHPRPLLEALITLAAVAATTKRVDIGTCVMLAALRQPLWLARQLGTLACFAPGRLRIGIGVGGEYKLEFEAIGVPLAERGQRVAEILRLVKGLLSGEPIPGLGEGATKARIEPVPRHPVPFLLAGWKEVALERAAALADGWIGYLLSAESFARRRHFLQQRRAELGGAPFITGMLLPVHLDRRLEGAQLRAAEAWGRITENGVTFPPRLFVAGPPAAIVEQLHRYWEAGCSEMVLSLVDQGVGFLDQLDLLATEVLPRLRGFAGNA